MRKIIRYREHIRNENPTNEKLREAAAADVLILSRGFSRLILSDLVLEYFICPGRTFIILEVLRHRLHTTYTHVDTHSSLSLSPSFKDSVPSIRRTFTENIFPRTPLRTCSNREWRIFGFSELDARETRGGRRGGNNCREIFQRGERPPPPTTRSAIFSIRSRPRIGIERGPFGCVTDDLDHRPCAAIDKTISCHLIAERAGDRCRFETSGASPINAGSLLRSVIGYASEFLSRFLPSFRSSIVRNRSEKWSAGRKEKSFEGRKGSARPISLFPRNANPSFPPSEPLVSALFHEIAR